MIIDNYGTSCSGSNDLYEGTGSTVIRDDVETVWSISSRLSYSDSVSLWGYYYGCTNNIKDVFDVIRNYWYSFKNELKKSIKEIIYVYIKKYRMDRLIGKREKRIGLKR